MWVREFPQCDIFVNLLSHPKISVKLFSKTYCTKVDAFQLIIKCMIFTPIYKIFFRDALRSWSQKGFVYTSHFWRIRGWFWSTCNIKNFLSVLSCAEVLTNLNSLIPYVFDLLKPFLRKFALNWSKFEFSKTYFTL